MSSSKSSLFINPYLTLSIGSWYARDSGQDTTIPTDWWYSNGHKWMMKNLINNHPTPMKNANRFLPCIISQRQFDPLSKWRKVHLKFNFFRICESWTIFRLINDFLVQFHQVELNFTAWIELNISSYTFKKNWTTCERLNSPQVAEYRCHSDH